VRHLGAELPQGRNAARVGNLKSGCAGDPIFSCIKISLGESLEG